MKFIIAIAATLFTIAAQAQMTAPNHVPSSTSVGVARSGNNVAVTLSGFKNQAGNASANNGTFTVGTTSTTAATGGATIGSFTFNANTWTVVGGAVSGMNTTTTTYALDNASVNALVGKVQGAATDHANYVGSLLNTANAAVAAFNARASSERTLTLASQTGDQIAFPIMSEVEVTRSSIMALRNITTSTFSADSVTGRVTCSLTGC